MCTIARAGSTIDTSDCSPTHPRARLARDTPNLVGERQESRWARTCLTKRARTLPCSNSVSSWVDRTFTMENSQATKNAFSATSAAMPASFPTRSIGGSHWGGTSRAIAAVRNNTGMFISRTRRLASETRIDPKLPAGLGYARDEPLRSQLAKGESRHLEPPNKGTAAPGDLASVHHTSWAGITRQARQAGIVFFRLQLRADCGVFSHRLALPLVAIDPGSLGHRKC